MAAKITIGGVDKTAYIDGAQSVTIDLTQNGRGRFNFTCMPGYEPARFSEVVAYAKDGITPIYGGVILQRSVAGLVSGSLTRQMNCEAVGFEAYLDWCFLDLTYSTNTTLQVVLDDIIAALPVGYGITLDATDYSGATLSAFTWKNVRASDGLRDLCNSTNRVYLVSPLKVLSLPSPGTTNAPVSITDADPNCRELTWQDPTDPPTTTIRLICGPTGNQSVTKTFYCDGTLRSWTWEAPDCAAGSIPASPAHRANAYLGVAIGENFANGETVTVDSVTYTYRTAINNSVANEILIGADANASLESLGAASMQQGGKGFTYSNATVLHPTCDCYRPADRDRMLWATCRTAGVAGNNISVTETAAHAFWYGEGGIPRDHMQLGADATFTVGSYGYSWTAWIIHEGLTIETDPAKRFVLTELSESGSSGWKALFDAPNLTFSIDADWTDASIPVTNGIIGAGHYIIFEYTGVFPFTIQSSSGLAPEIVRVETRTDIISVERANEVLVGLLERYGAAPRTFEISTLVDGWEPGQSLVVDLTDRAVDATLAITEVSIDLISAEFWTYTIQATELSVFPGTYLDQWRAFLSDKGGTSSGTSTGVTGTTTGGGTSPYYLGGSRFHAVQVPE